MATSKRSRGPSVLLQALVFAPLLVAAQEEWNFAKFNNKADVKGSATGANFSQAFNRNGMGNNAFGLRASLNAQRQQYNNWKAANDLSYQGQADNIAFKNFVANMAAVYDVNINLDISWWASGNKFSGMSSDEFKAGYTGSSGDYQTGSAIPQGSHLLAVPSSINWVTAGKVSPVKNQGGCNSCWAFAATAAIESSYMINVHDGKTPDLSEQQIISCASVSPWTSAGCNGGYPGQAMNYAATAHQTLESTYPYASTTGTCNTNQVAAAVGGAVLLLGNSGRVASNNEQALMQALMIGPAVVLVDAEASMQSYTGGIYSPSSSQCSSQVNHAVLAVGYFLGPTLAKSYFIVKNSWGDWGESGYLRIVMTGSGTAGACGMYQYVYTPQTSFIENLDLLTVNLSLLGLVAG